MMRFSICTILLTSAGAVLLLAAKRMQLDATQLRCVTIMAGGCLALHKLPTPRPILRVLAALTQLGAFSTALTVLVYCCGASGQPLADATLREADRLIGIDVGAIVQAISQRPAVYQLLERIYFTLIPQMLFLIVWLGWTESPALGLFVRRFMLTSLVCAAFFCWLPAYGNFVGYGLPVPASAWGFIGQLSDLRTGSLDVIRLDRVEALISFPSFHTILAVLFTVAFRRSRLFWPVALLNGLMIVSTLTSGMHYACDLLGAAVVCILAVLIVRK